MQQSHVPQSHVQQNHVAQSHVQQNHVQQDHGQQNHLQQSYNEESHIPRHFLSQSHHRVESRQIQEALSTNPENHEYISNSAFDEGGSRALQAKTAVQNQHTAGSQAAFGAKSSLAQAALGAAATAQAALVGKQVIAQGLKKQLIEAQHQLQAEITQYHQTQTAAELAETEALAQKALAAASIAQSNAAAAGAAVAVAAESSKHATGHVQESNSGPVGYYH
ncbi:unnamed protein product [Brassicogethes aeneus]|uniref:Uncharacterized protein n=1 Tax=Brassicogethes aeneus TaxID=1431903 RepID=A0A9P0FE52_BRAAE|nr:unnamed protein product [Brassicogethes aeneus]